MGSITRSFEADCDLTVFRVQGEVVAGQILDEIIAFLTGEPSQSVLWDITAGSLARISGEDMRMIARRGIDYAYRRKGGRTSIVCSTDVDYGLSRMFQTFVELMQSPFEITVSRDILAAREWLNGPGQDLTKPEKG